MGLLALLGGLTVVNLIRPQTTAVLGGAVDALVTDIKNQQLKAMAGDGGSEVSAEPYGLYIQSNQYTLFKDTTYSAGNTENFTVQNIGGITLSTTFPSSQIIFAEGTGEVSGFSGSNNTLTITNPNGGESRTLTLNRYGAITVN